MKELVCMCGHSKVVHRLGWMECYGEIKGEKCRCLLFTDKRISYRRAASKATREAGPKAKILKLLEVRAVRYFRLNSFDVTGRNPTGSKWRIKGNKPGTPDILCLIPAWSGTRILWIEAKSASGEQSPDQRAFESEATAKGEVYLLARSASEVKEWLQKNA